MHYRQNWQGILSICRKAGKLAMGLEPTKDAMYRGEVFGVLVASDASPKTQKEAAFYCSQAEVPCLQLDFTKADFACCLWTSSRSLIGARRSPCASRWRTV